MEKKDVLLVNYVKQFVPLKQLQLSLLKELMVAEKQQGIVALSGGNHAIAVSYAAQKFNIPATVIMPKTASPLRIKYCRDLGATVILEHDLTACFTKAEQLQQQGLTHIHPFDSQWVALGTGTLGLEIIDQWPECDIIISAVGGGGLCAGIANAIKQRKPSCQIFGVEPNGANAMSQSFRQGYPIKHIEPNTIADSLASPCALPYTYSLCQQHLDAREQRGGRGEAAARGGFGRHEVRAVIAGDARVDGRARGDQGVERRAAVDTGNVHEIGVERGDVRGGAFQARPRELEPGVIGRPVDGLPERRGGRALHGERECARVASPAIAGLRGCCGTLVVLRPARGRARGGERGGGGGSGPLHTAPRQQRCVTSSRRRAIASLARVHDGRPRNRNRCARARALQSRRYI